jgi:hypothetical protein
LSRLLPQAGTQPWPSLAPSCPTRLSSRLPHTDRTDENASTDEIIARLQREHPGVFGLDKPVSGNRKGRLASRYPGTGPSGKPQNIAS